MRSSRAILAACVLVFLAFLLFMAVQRQTAAVEHSQVNPTPGLIRAQQLAPEAVLRAGTRSAACAAQHPDVLIYNRVPKAGSTTLKTLLREQSQALGFEFNDPQDDYYPAPDSLARTFARLCTRRPRCVYINHMNFPAPSALKVLDDRGLSYAFINVVREPVQQMRSYFQYKRFGDRLEELKAEELAKFNGTFAECLRAGHEECSRDKLLLLQYFSSLPYEDLRKYVQPGQSLFQLQPVLQDAVSNINRYTAIGLQREFEETLAVLELVLPGFFTGVVERQRQHASRNESVLNASPASPLTAPFGGDVEGQEHVNSDAAVAARMMYILGFKVEDALYKYIESKFHEQKRLCGVESAVAKPCPSDAFVYGI